MKYTWIPVLICTFIVSACSNLGQSQDEYNAFADPRVQADPTLKLTLLALPNIKDESTLNIVVNYSIVAEAWWLEYQCKILGEEAHFQFKDRVANMTIFTHGELQKAWGPESMNPFGPNSPRESKYIESIQLYALNQVSASSFYDCNKIDVHKIINFADHKILIPLVKEINKKSK